MPQIIALGGGGFSMEPDNLALDKYILAQSTQPRPKVCFVPTASGDADGYVLKFYQSFARLECQPSFLSLFRLPSADLEDFVMEKDVIYVGGGNTFSLLALWRAWGLDEILRKAYRAGVILAGISAGANCWFEQFSTDSVPGQLRVMEGLGLAQGSFSPHFDAEAARRPWLHEMLKSRQIKAGFGAENSAGVHVVDGGLYKAVCSRPEAKVYQIELRGDEVVEEPLPMFCCGPD
jgi:peptidase E